MFRLTQAHSVTSYFWLKTFCILNEFSSFQNSHWPVLTHFIAVFLAGLCVTQGVKTIEKVSIALVPLLMILVLFTFVWSLTRENAGLGIKFLFTPKWGMTLTFLCWQNCFTNFIKTNIRIYSNIKNEYSNVYIYFSISSHPYSKYS